MGHSRWNVLPPAPGGYLATMSGFSPLIAQLLYNRGLTTPAQVHAFFATDPASCGDPLLLPDMHRAVTRLYRAVLGGEQIAVYGDFDTDGVTATALLVHGLNALGARATPYIPHRLTEGYGLKTLALEKLFRQGVSLVVSVDCGITALTQVKRARRIGLDVIVTDHHMPLEALPEAAAVVDPKRSDSAYPFADLTGAGVALKLLQALYRGLGKDGRLEGLLDLAAIGTVADMAPLCGENRYLVKEGLRVINASPRLGLREIFACSGLTPGSIDAENISWTIAPRLNSAGRLAYAMTSYRLLTTGSADEARELASSLEQQNVERQKLSQSALSRAREQVEAQGISTLLLVTDAECPAGVAGLVAGRLCEEFYRPAVVIHTGEQSSSGSCRSIPEFNIVAALTSCRHLLDQFGGHTQAAGFTLPTRNVPQLQEALADLAEAQLAGVELRPRLDIDAETTLPELIGDTFPTIQKLAPFGRGNPMPAFLSRRVEVADCRGMGNNGGHLRLKLKQGKTVWEAVAFGLGAYLGEVASPLDIVYNLELDRWGGEPRLRLNLLDFAPAA